MQALFFPLDCEGNQELSARVVSRYASKSEMDENQHSHTAISLVDHPPPHIDALKYLKQGFSAKLSALANLVGAVNAKRFQHVLARRYIL